MYNRNYLKRVIPLFLGLIIFYPINKTEIKCYKNYNNFITDSLNQINLALFIKELEIKEPENVFKQSMLETGYLKSNLAVNHNNLFGMKKAGKWKQHFIKIIKNRDLSYLHWKLSVIDYKIYQLLFGTKLKNYNKNPHYKKALQNIKIDSNIIKILRK